MLIGGKTLIQHRNHARASSRTIQPQNTPVRGKLKAPLLELYYCMNSTFKFAFKLFSEHLCFKIK